MHQAKHEIGTVRRAELGLPARAVRAGAWQSNRHKATCRGLSGRARQSNYTRSRSPQLLYALLK